MSSHPQFTVAEPVTLTGVGLHTGESCRAVLRPSESGRVIFCRDGREIPATTGSVAATARCTTIGSGDATVSTVEHLMAALSALSVASVEVHVSGPEMPILDGSAGPIVQALRCAGLRAVPGKRSLLHVPAPVWLEDSGSSMLALPSDRYRVTVIVDYPHPMIGRQVVDEVVDAETFAERLAPARTFGFESEVEELLRRGLARGGSLENALVFMNDGTATPIRFPDEPARHKALDIIGDVALTGALPMAHIIAVRPSHRLNVAFARRLIQIQNGEGGAQPASDLAHEGDTT